ncbi:protein argonaute-3 [Condylostylus longicornis]|uniref:protein argonaute-3 n=1 Tax=Condylostylus longicornis TaxID=2530218 RepID=UPI00244E1117|nr:protein argonaute-3 [Condylostylus longicornis]
MSFGGGRGALLRALCDSQSSSSGEETSKDKTPSGDSGLILGSSTKLFVGRGRAELSDSTSEGLSITGRGRAALLNTTPSSSGISVARGRGSLFRSCELKVQSTASRSSTEDNIIDRVEKLELSEYSTSTPTTTPVPIPTQHVKAGQNIQPVVKKGTYGTQVKTICNYIRLTSDPNKGVFEYEVKFVPNVDSRNLRIKYLNDHRSKFGGTKTFDGVTLYLPIMLPQCETTYTSQNVDGTPIEIKLIYKRKKPLRDCVHLYNILFDRIMKTLNFVRHNRKQFDPTAPKIIPQHKLEVWPGYVTAVDEYEGGVMLCCDVSHRILSSTTVLEILEETYRTNPTGFQENAKKALIGSIVLTRYNNKTYRIDDIDFTSNPMSTFMAGEKTMSFEEYYRTQYNINIRDVNQPLLTSIKKRRVSNKENPEEIIFSLIPEICYLTGLTDHMRSNFKVMKDIATYTRVTPNQRVLALEKFIKSVNENKDAREILSDWGLSLDNETVKLMGRQLGTEQILFAKRKVDAGVNADFGKHATSNELLDVVNFTNWILMFTNNDTKIANSFLDFLERNSRPMGIEVRKPKTIILRQDKTEEYVSALRKCISSETQIVVVICPTSRDDRYAAIKKICCVENPVPSQVINARTLKNDAKNRSIVQKIALQMNCKMGGTLWSIRIPFKNVMICGIDSYHDNVNKSNSVSAFVASLNFNYTRWYSRAIIQTKGEEIVNGLCVSLEKALTAYENVNRTLPDKIIIFRDGVGDGQLKVVSEYEIPQLKKSCKIGRENYEPLFTYVVVQKRINTRIFTENGEVKNPEPGFVVDHEVTRRYMYDFFLVSQSIREGTVSPCHYIVVCDSANYSPDILQRLSYKLCFLYYNWPGTITVPACCQYAHKMAFLVGQSIKKPTSETLSDLLFYL